MQQQLAGNNAAARQQKKVVRYDPLGMAVIPSVMNVGVPEMGPHTWSACGCCSLSGSIQGMSVWYMIIGIACIAIGIMFCFIGYLFSLTIAFFIYATFHIMPAYRGFKFVKLISESEYYAMGEKLYVDYLVLCTVNLSIAAIGIAVMIAYHYEGYHTFLRWYFFTFVLPFGLHGLSTVYCIYILKQYFRLKAFEKYERDQKEFQQQMNMNNVQLLQA